MQETVKKLRYPLLIMSGLVASLGVVYPQYFGLLAWISLIPAGLVLLTLGGRARSGSMYLYGLVFYFTYYVMGYHWFISMYPMDFAGFEPGVAAGVIALAVLGISSLQASLSALMFLIFGLFCRTIVLQKYPVLKPILFACLWVINEWSQTIGWTGLPWSRLYLSQSYLLPMAQSASLLGGLFVSFLIVAVNLAFAGVIACRGARLSHGLLGGCLLGGNLLFGLAAMSAIKGSVLPWQIAFFALALVTVIMALVYGLVRRLGADRRLLKAFLCIGLTLCILSSLSPVLASYPNAGTPVKAAALQGNLSSKDKWAKDAGWRSFRVYAALTEQAAAAGADLIVWPETSLAYTLFAALENSETRAPLSAVYDMAERTGTTVLIGTFTSSLHFDPGAEEASTNSVITIYPDRSYDESIYVKRMLVPFGEYVPWRDLILSVVPALGEINMLSSDLVRGQEATVVELKTHGMGVGPIICFDSIYEETVRQTVAAGAEIISLSTNDSWFTDSAAVYMHNNQSKFRAIENGRYLVRSANTGVSSIVAPDGRELGRQEALTTGLVIAEIHARSNTTPYTSVGYLLVWMSFLAQIALIAAQIAFVAFRRYKCHKKPCGT
ncbi:MAG: apolipoprotein N-acyltransferase [Ruminococcaceae bacterium]|nr:apolipoprotein N-acyltransferase [Oscillospiraceae bacterium]